jgi:hypothetical protein
MFKLEWGEPDHPDFVEITFDGQKNTIELSAGQDDYEVWGSVTLNIEQAREVYRALGNAIEGLVDL